MRMMATLLGATGTAAHSNAKRCLVMPESAYQRHMATMHALNAFVNEDLSSGRECYDQVLSSRTDSLRRKGPDVC